MDGSTFEPLWMLKAVIVVSDDQLTSRSRDGLLADIYRRANRRRRRRLTMAATATAALGLGVALPFSLAARRHSTTLHVVAPAPTQTASPTTNPGLLPGAPVPTSTSSTTQPPSPEAATSTAMTLPAYRSPATTAIPPVPRDCAASELGLTARPDKSTYQWGETMYVTANLTSTAVTTCQVATTQFSPGDCYPSVIAQYSSGQTNGLLGPGLAKCSTGPVVLIPGSATTTTLSLPFQCGTGSPDCLLAHDGIEEWHVVVEWATAGGQKQPTTFNVTVESATGPTTTTTVPTAPASTTTTRVSPSPSSPTSTSVVGN